MRLFKRAIIQDSFLVFFANGFTLAANIIVGLLVPLKIGVHEYAFYALFILYVAFVGFAHFGLLDGVYISLGGFDYETLPITFVRSSFVLLALLQFSVAITLVFAAVVFEKNFSHLVIYLFVIANMVFVNFSTFFAFLNQITKRFRAFAFNTVGSRLCLLFASFILFLGNVRNHLPYVFAFTIANLFSVVLYFSMHRDIVWGDYPSFEETREQSLRVLKLGFAIMLGNIFGMIVINAGRFIVQSRFSPADFAVFSFAAYLMSVIYLMAQAVALAIYPRLSNRKPSELAAIYKKLKVYSFMGIGAALFLYFPLCYLVRVLMPGFSDSLIYARWLFPAIIYKSQYSLIHSNYFKFLQLKREYFWNGLLAVVIAFALGLSAYRLFGSLKMIAIATVITWVIWVAVSDAFFCRRLGIDVRKENLCQALATLGFYASFSVRPPILSGIVYTVLLLAVLGSAYRREIGEFFGAKVIEFS